MPVAPPPRRVELAARLRERRGEVEEALHARVYAIADAGEAADPSYAAGLRAAVAAALEYGLTALEESEVHPPAVPVELLAQARLAARNGIGVDTVLRRYFGGYVLLGEFLAQEAAAADLPSASLKRLMHTQAGAFDRLIVEVSEAHAREVERRPRTSERRRAEQIQRLLAGESLDTSDVAYNFEGHHVGLVADERGSKGALRELAGSLDARLLLVRPDEAAVWAWLGSRRPLDPGDIEAGSLAFGGEPPVLALGEPADGLAGWRLTHRQALAAFPVAMRREGRIARYAEVALLTAVLNNDLLAISLRRFYLEPLEAGRDDGEAARQTLRAYFAAGNVSSAAAALGVSRRTVSNRLRAIEEKLGLSVDAASAALETALRFDELVDPRQLTAQSENSDATSVPTLAGRERLSA